MKHLLLVMLGGSLGAGGRHLVSLWTLRLFGPGFPVGTLTVNVVGSLIMGLFIGALTRFDFGDNQSLRYLVATGFLGGFTTFSAFSLDTALLWEKGAGLSMIAYVCLSVGLSIAAVFLGLFLVRSLWPGTV